jgi:periplasmic binding family protein
MNDEQLKEYRSKHGFDILHFPTVLGADVPTYNIPGITTSLNFTPEALAGIFLGRNTKWNDPELVKASSKVKLPNTEIVFVHRSQVRVRKLRRGQSQSGSNPVQLATGSATHGSITFASVRLV